ncbi:TIGR01777 family oxidoreductase [Roseimaritima sediminicola]|uniref:TIGR01777 family oxidoreductase n=1 Tax=Roseimaritima sediminicola TaxID=2662066 RepID=UPI001298536D|nr:TIGR01777 family oxidoreductase [Roseimaritima sediminicola]
MSQDFEATLDVPVSRETLFAYHDAAGALQRLLPPWEPLAIEHSDQSLRVGSEVRMRGSLLGLPLRYTARHTQYEPPRLFQDVQAEGPFGFWRHDHRFEENGPNASRLIDHIEYGLPAGVVGRWAGAGLAERKLQQMFRYRHRVTLDDLSMQANRPLRPLRIGVSGASGLVGTQLVAMLRMLGHTVDELVRGKAEQDGEIAVWDDAFAADAAGNLAKLRRLDAVIHLAGKPIADQRWTAAVKQQIRSSRVDKTRQLCQRLAELGPDRPDVLLCASASGYYGDRGDQVLTETASPGDGFLTEVAQQWEAACGPAGDAGIRVAQLRFGIVLSPQGGALQKTLLPARFGGGHLGGGKQWWSWIALDDVLGGIYHALVESQVQGPINFVSPQPVTNRQFTKTLAGVLNRPALVPAPAFALRMALGEMADSLLLASVRAVPERLQETGYTFRFADLQSALRHLLGRWPQD